MIATSIKLKKGVIYMLAKYKKNGEKRYAVVDVNGRPVKIIKNYLMYLEKVRQLEVFTINEQAKDLNKYFD